MDFFSKLGKKASKTYQVTKEKAVNLSEELKLKGKINDLKDKIEDIYIEIGKIVYNEIKDGKDVSKEEVTEKCEVISNYKEKIEKLQSDILALKNVVRCANCGVELDLGDPFCYKCGTKQPKVEKVEIKEETEDVVKNAAVVEIAETTVEISNDEDNTTNENNNNDNDDNNDNNNNNNNN